MREKCIEARLFWGPDLEAVSYSAVVPNVYVGEVRVTDEHARLVDDVIRLENDLELRLAIVEREAPLPRSIGDGRVERALLAAAALHALFAAVAFHGRAAPGDEEERAQATMAGYLAAIDARANDRANEIVPPQVPPPDDKGGGEAANGATGAAGNPAKTNDVGRAKETKGAAYHASRSENGGAEVSTFGILALLAADHRGDNAGSSPWAKDLGPAAMGNMFGATIDDAFGNGGLGLSGNGEGGGGRGAGYSLDHVGPGGSGTCGDDCTGGIRGYARMGGGRVRGEHTSRFVFMRCEKKDERDCYAQVNGRLPPEAIQRVIRASFGRFRGCYEQGLQRNPTIEGRIATKFVIARDGSVAMVSTDESSIADPSVAKCVERAFYNLAFPQPEGGIVTVVYPIVFSTSP